MRKISSTTKIHIKKEPPPGDYHCTCDYCTNNYLGELYDIENNKYYSQADRYSYYPRLKEKHLCPGHWSGYRYAIQHFTKEGDWVLDPTVGTGTAIIEAINNGRNATGIELEFPEIARKNIEHQFSSDPIPTGQYDFISGDALEIKSHIKNLGGREFSLIVNGTPYPSFGKISSDAPERNSIVNRSKEGPDKFFNYEDPKNLGKLGMDKYYDFITNLYVDCCTFLKPRGYFIIIIKDLTRAKQPYLLHKHIIDNLLERDKSLKYFGSFIHNHYPPTLFMNTYNKRFPDVKIPRYQTAIVLKKKKKS